MIDEVADKMSESDDRVVGWEDQDRYWRESFRSRPYVTADRGYDFYQPAYRYGWESATRHQGKSWSEVEPDLERGWETFKGGGWADFKGQSKVGAAWTDVKDAVRDAWDRMTGSDERAAKRVMAEDMNSDAGTSPGAR